MNGGHEPLVILHAQGIKEKLKSTGPAVGMLPNLKFKVRQTYLEPGDMLFGYTDGVPEARDPLGGFFTEQHLFSLLNQPVSQPSELLDRLDTYLTNHIAEADQFDDITMLAVRRQV